MTGDEIEAQSRVAYVIDNRTENVSNYDVPLKARQDFSGFYDNSVRSALLDSTTEAVGPTSSAAAAAISNHVRLHPSSLHPSIAPLRQTAVPSHNAGSKIVIPVHTKIDLPVRHTDWNAPSSTRSTHRLTQRHSFTDHPDADSNHCVRQYPMTRNTDRVEQASSSRETTRQLEMSQFTVIDQGAPTSPRRSLHRSHSSAFSPPTRRLPKPLPIRPGGLSVPVSVTGSPDHGYVTLERVWVTERALPMKTPPLSRDKSIVPVVSVQKTSTAANENQQVDDVRSGTTSAVVMDNGLCDGEYRRDSNRAIGSSFVRRRQRLQPERSRYESTKDIAPVSYHITLNRPGDDTNGNVSATSTDIDSKRIGDSHRLHDRPEAEIHIPLRIVDHADHVVSSVDRDIIRAESDLCVDGSIGPNSISRRSDVFVVHHRSAETNGSRGISTGLHGSASECDIRRHLQPRAEVIGRGQENSVATLSVGVLSAESPYSEDLFTEHGNGDRLRPNSDKCGAGNNSYRNNFSTGSSFKAPPLSYPDTVTVSSGPQLVLCCPTSRAVDGCTDADEATDVIRGLLRLLEQRDDELRMLRSTMDGNEMAMLTVIEDSRREWEAGLVRCRIEFERRLNREIEAARATELSLMSEVDDLRSKNAALQRSASGGKQIGSVPTFLPDSQSAVDCCGRKTFPDSQPMSGLLDSKNNDRKRTVDIGVDVSAAASGVHGAALVSHRSAPDVRMLENVGRDGGGTSNGDNRSQSTDVEYLRRCLHLAKEELERVSKDFANERERWLMEKERVIAYQLQLQLNYVQVIKRNAALEMERRQLMEELIQLVTCVGPTRKEDDDGRMLHRQYLATHSSTSRSAGLNNDGHRVAAVQLGESNC